MKKKGAFHEYHILHAITVATSLDYGVLALATNTTEALCGVSTAYLVLYNSSVLYVSFLYLFI